MLSSGSELCVDSDSLVGDHAPFCLHFTSPFNSRAAALRPRHHHAHSHASLAIRPPRVCRWCLALCSHPCMRLPAQHKMPPAIGRRSMMSRQAEMSLLQLSSRHHISEACRPSRSLNYRRRCCGALQLRAIEQHTPHALFTHKKRNPKPQPAKPLTRPQSSLLPPSSTT